MNKKITEDFRVRLMVAAVVISLLLIFSRGISTGLDIQGGSLIQIQTERSLSASEMDQVVMIMDQRLRGGLGVRDVSVVPWGEEFIIIKIAGVSPEDAEKLLGKPGRLVVRVGDFIAFTGDELKRVDPFGKNTRSGGWGVPFTLSDQAAEKFRDVAVATDFDRVYMYMDEETGIRILSDQEVGEDILKDLGYEGKIVTASSNLTGFAATITLDVTLDELGERGKERIEGVLEDRGVDVRNITYARTGLVNAAPISPGLQAELAAGQVVKGLIIETGSGEDGRLEAKRIEAILRSGALPIKVSVVGTYGISPTLGAGFARNALLAGFLAFLGVAAVVFLRYRKPVLVLPILVTGLSEVIIILGVASLIRWDIDMPAIAGIIAAVGTGVDDQIVILDEILLETAGRVRTRISKAFFIVMGTYFTLVAAMVPLFIIALGMLEGFAVTTIIGATAGVFITRTAFARIVEYSMN
ncbi:MAG: hypothetical protein V3T58_06300 [Candidatus Hydrothermarchaeales archaeon]